VFAQPSYHDEPYLANNVRKMNLCYPHQALKKSVP
jgi:hypothetical protein